MCGLLCSAALVRTAPFVRRRWLGAAWIVVTLAGLWLRLPGTPWALVLDVAVWPIPAGAAAWLFVSELPEDRRRSLLVAICVGLVWHLGIGLFQTFGIDPFAPVGSSLVTVTGSFGSDWAYTAWLAAGAPAALVLLRFERLPLIGALLLASSAVASVLLWRVTPSGSISTLMVVPLGAALALGWGPSTRDGDERRRSWAAVGIAIALAVLTVAGAARLVQRFVASRAVAQGMTALEVNDWFGAFEAFQRAERVQPDALLAALCMASVYTHPERDPLPEDFVQAQKRVQRATELGVRDSLNCLIGEIELGTGRAEAAERSFRVAVRSFPRDARTFHGLGASLVAQGREREALPILARAVALEPQSAFHRSWLGHAHEAVGDLATAEVELGRAARMAPEWEDAASALARVRAKRTGRGDSPPAERSGR